MKKKGIIITTILMMIFNCSFSQLENKFSFFTIPNLYGDRINVDNRGNIYIISETTLFKYSIEGKLLFSYNNFMLGRISSVDVTSPLKIMLFYEETGNIIFLDEHLIPMTDAIDLVSKQYLSIPLAAFSTNNNIWIYDNINRDLVQLDFYFNLLNKNHYNFAILQPTQLIVSTGKNIIIHDTKSGILFFDAFGTYLKTLPILTENDIQIDEMYINYIKNNNLHCYNYRRLEEDIINLGIENLKQVLRYRKHFIILQENGTVLISQ